MERWNPKYRYDDMLGNLPLSKGCHQSSHNFVVVSRSPENLLGVELSSPSLLSFFLRRQLARSF